MAKKAPVAKSLTRKQLARHEKEKRLQRIILWIAIAVIAIVAVVTVYGVVSETIKARTAVARVGEVKLTTSKFVARQKYERAMIEVQINQYEQYLSQIQSYMSAGSISETMTITDTATMTDTLNLEANAENQALIEQLQVAIASLENQLSSDYANIQGDSTLSTMIEEEIVRQEAMSRGITVPKEDIDRTVETQMGYDRDAATDTLTETVSSLSLQDYEKYYQEFRSYVLQPANFSEREFRTMIEAGLLQEKLLAELTTDTESVQDQVQVTVFALATEEAATAIRERINGGEDSGTILTELNTDDDDTSSAAAYPWLPLGYISTQLSEDLERAAFNTSVGKATEPMLGPGDQYFVLFVGGHEERELSTDFLDQKRQQVYDDWLTEQIDNNTERFDWESAVITE